MLDTKERLDFLVKLASKLDKLGLHDLANKVDTVIKAESDGIEAILSIYKELHKTGKTNLKKTIQAVLRKDNRPDMEGCPFGLPIPRACKYAGEAVLEMCPRKVEFKHNRRLYNNKRTHDKCPYALQVVENSDAVRCSYGTINAGVPAWQQFRSSPLYPKLWQGFNIPDVLMDRNYYTYNDYNYYSLY